MKGNFRARRITKNFSQRGNGRARKNVSSQWFSLAKSLVAYWWTYHICHRHEYWRTSESRDSTVRMSDRDPKRIHPSDKFLSYSRHFTPPPHQVTPNDEQVDENDQINGNLNDLRLSDASKQWVNDNYQLWWDLKFKTFSALLLLLWRMR